MALSIGISTGFHWLGSPGRHFFEKKISIYFDNDENLTQLSLGQLRTMLAKYATEDGPTREQMEGAKAFVERFAKHWKKQGYEEDDARTVQVSF